MFNTNRGCLYWLLCVIAGVVAILGIMLLLSIILIAFSASM